MTKEKQMKNKLLILSLAVLSGCASMPEQKDAEARYVAGTDKVRTCMENTIYGILMSPLDGFASMTKLCDKRPENK